MNRIDKVFKTGRKVFVPYITAGYPSVDETITIMHDLVANGADIIELGYPFSDPTADGPVIQVSSQQSLEAGFRRDDYFRILSTFREKDQDTPVVVFSYFNPIFNLGVETFARRAKEAGGDGFLVVDVPFEEQPELRPTLDALDLHLIQLIAPTTPQERARTILANATGFVYQIARRGVTGMRTTMAEDASENARLIKDVTDLPIALGFGVSTPEQAAAIASYTDGVVVGSAIVKTITDNLPDYQPSLQNLIKGLADAIHS